MKLIICLTVALAAVALVATGEQQRILRRVIKSTPTATNLARVRLVTVRAANGAESGAVTEITSKEAASFGQRSANETASGSTANQPATSGLKTKLSPQSTTSSTTTTPSTTTSTTSTTTIAPTSSTSATPTKPKASERQQVSGAEVELLASAPSSWQTMTAVEAPAAMLIATGTRPVASDLSSASSTLYASEESAATSDFLRGPAGTKGGAYNQQQSSVGETFSRLRQQSASKQSTQQQQQQSFFYPQPAPARASPSKTSNQQASKTHWYQQPSITTARPAPIVQEQYEQQNDYVQQQQVEYGAAPSGQAEPFAFDFKTEDNSGNGQYRKEESDKNGVVHGSYGYTDANGIYRHVEYVADKDGFRANIKSNEPGLIGETQPASIQLSGSGPAPNQRLATRPQSNADNGEWTSNNNDNNNNPAPSADLALAPPDFESAHKSDRLRLPRHYRN